MRTDYAFNPLTGVLEPVIVVEPAGPLVFEQAVPSNHWIFVHNLGYEPSGVQPIDSSGNHMATAKIVHVSINELHVFIGAATSGKIVVR